MDKSKATEFVELALEALRDLEDAIRTGEKHTIDLKTEVIRQALFSVLEIIQSEKND
jgi:hypothetical protein